MIKPLFLLLLGLLLAGCTTANTQAPPQEETPMPLPNLGPAPELTNDTWLNTDEPLRLANLRGKVVLLDMWTFG